MGLRGGGPSFGLSEEVARSNIGFTRFFVMSLDLKAITGLLWFSRVDLEAAERIAYLEVEVFACNVGAQSDYRLLGDGGE